MDRELLSKAINACAINDVYVRETKVTLDEDFDPNEESKVDLDIQYRVGARESKLIGVSSPANINHVFLVAVQAGLRYVAPGEEDGDKVMAEIEVSFIAQYHVLGDEPPPEDALEEFATRNAPYHVWPYWREYAHSLCYRHRLQPVVMPMLTIDMLSDAKPE